jgi:hypothetical protein
MADSREVHVKRHSLVNHRKNADNREDAAL